MEDRIAIATVMLAVANIPLYLWVGHLFFGGWREFWEAIVFWFKPDSWSFLQGEWMEDKVASFKLGIFLLICGGLVAAELFLIMPLLGLLG